MKFKKKNHIWEYQGKNYKRILIIKIDNLSIHLTVKDKQTAEEIVEALEK